MTTESLKAWIIHKRWCGETSVKLTFFTREKGIVQAIYKGARMPKKRAVLQPFSPLFLFLNEYKDWHYVRQLEASGGSFLLYDKALMSALYVNELLYYALKPEEPQSELYEAYERVLNQLANSTRRAEIESALRRFEWILLTACGYAVSLETEAHTLKPIDPEKDYEFRWGEGVVLADQGVPGKCLLAFAQDNLQKESDLHAIKLLMRKIMDCLLEGKPLQVRRLMQKQ